MTRLLASAVLLAASLLAGCGSTVVNPVTGQAERTVMDERTELVEGKKALKKRAAKKPTKGWAELGLPGIPN